MDLLVKCRCICGASPFGEFLDVIEPTSNTDLLGTYASTRFPFIPIPREEILLTAHSCGRRWASLGFN
jgi:hypothetical protein